MPTLTKSKYLKGLQCHRLLWFDTKKLLPEITLADQHKFDQGGEFEEQVYRLFPEGVNLSNTKTEDNLKQTKELIEEKKTIFEAGIQHNNFFIRADILEPKKNSWNLYEIKSTTKVKKHHFPDLAFQKFVCEKAGLKIKRCFIIHLNNEYVKKGEIEPNKLITKEDVTEEVIKIKDIEKNAEKFFEAMQEKIEPPITISQNCKKPYDCPLKDHCWGTLPENNVLHLTNWRQYWKFFGDGIIDMKDIPKSEGLKPQDEIIRTAAMECKAAVSKEQIKCFMKTLHYSLYHFDFETFDTAVPIYDNSRPYQKIPFQYSLHIQHADRDLEHFEYLATGDEDPRIKLLEQLKNEIGEKGSVVVFNKSFEVSVLTKLAEDFPEHAGWIQNVLKRIVDLAVPFQNFHYYCPTQKGSYSIKKVLPAITGKGYGHLEINNGAEASVQYYNAHIKDKLKIKDKLRKDLLAYCKLDTEAMVWIVNELEKLI